MEWLCKQRNRLLILGGFFAEKEMNIIHKLKKGGKSLKAFFPLRRNLCPPPALKCDGAFVLALSKAGWVCVCILIYHFSGSACQGESCFCRLIYIFKRGADLSAWLSESDTDVGRWTVASRGLAQSPCRARPAAGAQKGRETQKRDVAHTHTADKWNEARLETREKGKNLCISPESHQRQKKNEMWCFLRLN